jgi:hypothetical protein
MMRVAAIAQPGEHVLSAILSGWVNSKFMRQCLSLPPRCLLANECEWCSVSYYNLKSTPDGCRMAAQLQPSDFHLVDPAALPTPPSTAQMVADLHAHTLL